MTLKQKLKLVPEKAGVYLFKDKKGRILYIGKALSLKKRVKSYFQKGEFSPRIGAFVSRIEDMDWIVTQSEAEAFLLESNLIKHHHPKYNIRFRDDKSYPYIKLSTNEDFPRAFLTRNPKRDGSTYFGPYTNVKAAKKTLRLIHRLFPLRRCRDKFKNRLSPCLNFYIKECSAPCVGRINKEDYEFLVKGVFLFLQGHYESLILALRCAMLKASQNQEFERAANIRDAIRAIERMGQKQTVTSFPGEDIDVIAIAREGKDACVVVFPIREGNVVDRNHFLLNIDSEDTGRDILTSFVKQYYARASFLPSQIVVPGKIEEKKEIISWLTQKKGERVRILFPQNGDKKRLLRLAAENAKLLLTQTKSTGNDKALFQLKEYLELSRLPLRIEGVDVSNIAGCEATGSVVVFEEGQPEKSEYRKFKIKTIQRIDDFAMLEEVIKRRYRKVLRERKELPQLVLIDGGKGQVGICSRALKELNLQQIFVVGLAKEMEQVFLPTRSAPVDIPLNSPAMKLLQRVRDEAHRFAHSYHIKKRQKKITESELEKIPGIGEQTKKLLLSHLKSLDGVKKASLKELMDVPGIGEKRGKLVKNWLDKNER
ncbi:excinuclease ABC subunit UvrC [Candidatus Aerophobetes bacterium]|nr:excinuclease ABC subunit UvrC [Candidatus Aerophobetes bacterium]